MIDIEALQQLLQAAGPRKWPAIAEATDVPLRTLQKIAYGKTKAPRAPTYIALAKYFAANEEQAA
jgi:hypothetical protein